MPLSVAERQAALRRRFPTWTPRTLDQMLDAAAREFPNRAYVVTEKVIFTFAQMKARSEEIAGGLVEAGVQRGDHVAVVLANYADFVAIKYAIARLGATCVPINFLNRRDELGYVLRQSDAALLITMDRFRGLDYLSALDELAPNWERAGGGEAFPRLKRIVVFPASGEPLRLHATPFAQIEAPARPYFGLADADPHAVSDIIYTSGTTGTPKGVMLTHDMLLRAAFASVYSRAFDDGWRIVFSLPMYHVYGYVEGMLTVPFVGGCIAPQLVFDPAATLAAVERWAADDLLLVPTMTLGLIEELRAKKYALPTLRAVISSGQRSPAGIWKDILELLHPTELTTGYGMTEVTATTTLTRPDDPIDRLLTTNGRMRDAGPAGDLALGGKLVNYKVVDPETGATLPSGEVGELMAKGPGVTKGYYNKPDATAEVFDAEGWLRTGDLGRFDGDGYLTLVGRCKESYRCGGEQVMPTEVEDVLTSHPAVLQAHVVPAPDKRMGEVGVAFVILRAEPTTTSEALIRYCAERLARFKTPKYVLPIRADELPTTPSGRARKFLLTQRAIKQLGLS